MLLPISRDDLSEWIMQYTVQDGTRRKGSRLCFKVTLKDYLLLIIADYGFFVSYVQGTGQRWAFFRCIIFSAVIFFGKSR
jgi:hypothetical protein